MKQKNKSFGKQVLSMLLAMVLLVSGITFPVQADSVQDEELKAQTQENAYVYFQYDDGRIQEMDENETFTLSPLDEGTFVLAGTGKKAYWECETQLDSYNKHFWISSSGRYEPLDVRKVDAVVKNSDDPNEVLKAFHINNVSSNIEELKVFVGEQEICLDKPYEAQGSETVKVTVKGKVKDAEQWITVPLGALEYDKESGQGIFSNSEFSLYNNGEAVFKVSLKENKKIQAKFKAVSQKVPLESFSISVPKVWYIHEWNGLGGYYLGIEEGSNPEKNFQCTFEPANAGNKKLYWKALTPEIAEYMEAFHNGIIPKKAGIAKFEVSSIENPDIKQEISVEFKYQYPLQGVTLKKDTIELEEGSYTNFEIETNPKDASEQRFHWSYDKEGIVKVGDTVTIDPSDVSIPKETIHTIRALKAGVVTVTGTPYDETANCKPIQFTVNVLKDGVIPDDTDYLSLAKNDIEHGTAYLSRQAMEKYGDEWNLFTVLRSGKEVSQETLNKYYKSVEKQVKEKVDKMRATDLARVILTLEAMGKNPANVGGVNLLEKLYNNKTMASDTSNCPIWALIALDGWKSEIPSDALWTRQKLIKQILTFQTDKGGFGLIDNKTSSIDMTGMALQALAPYYNNEKYPEVKNAVDKSLDYLKSEMTNNAGYLDGGKENSCTTAQVLTAITALNIDPLSAEGGFISGSNNMVKNLDSYKAEEGFGWQDANRGNGMATQQVTYAMEAYRRFAEKENSLYDITDVKDQQQDKEAADKVIKKIEAIGDKINLESEKEIEEARKAYDDLTEVQKKLVTNYDKLTKAEKELESIKPSKDHVVISVERFTIGQGYYKEPVEVPMKDGDTVVTLLKKVIGAENYMGYDDFFKGIKGADLGVDKVIVPSYISEKLDGPTTEEAKKIGNSDNDLDYMDYGNYSKWAFTANNRLKGCYDVGNYKPKNGDVLRFQFSLLEGPDINGCKWNTNEVLVEISNKDELTKVMAKVNGNRDKLMAVEEVKAAYDEAVKAISPMITPQNKIDAVTEKLKKAVENAQGGLSEDQKAADKVIQKIEAIGEKITLESKEKIEVARKAYDALTDDQKKLVTNLDKLTKAEEELKKLEGDQRPESGHVVISVERFTIGQGYIYEPVFVPFEKGDNAATLLKKVIGSENFVGKDEYLEAIVGGDLGTDKVVVPEYIEKLSNGQVTTETAREWGNEDNGDGGDALGEFDYSNYSGWMYHVNGEAVGYGISAYEPKDGDVLRFQFTMYGYGTDLTGYEYGNPNPVIDICNKDEITKLMAEVNEDRENLMTVPEVKAAYDQAVQLVSAVITPKEEIDAATAKLREAVENAKKVPEGWQETSEGWQYYENGQKVTGWLFVENHWYYMNSNGIMTTGWVAVDGHWYYMDQWGAMCTGWIAVDGHWYYMDQWGAMCTGWIAVDGHWYYMDQWGAMMTGWVSVNGHWYYMDQWGAMMTGWVSVNGHWYYMDQWGAMMTGWVSVNGHWYYLNTDGSMAASQWIGDYYVQADGAMATSQWIGGYYVDTFGKWVRNA